ncbi:TPA: transcriptional regulator, partial [Staphylococcus aureus]|nr:transcriptional regulator [Staphylococcus aureus]HDD2346774.1 transcriptional regulator [Staphylococcus aureus]HDD2346816.1 transcriptional regulator [Staphylococcus aureus]
MIKIEKHDIKKLEEYIQHIDNYRRELKMREYELLESHEPDNAG